MAEKLHTAVPEGSHLSSNCRWQRERKMLNHHMRIKLIQLQKNAMQPFCQKQQNNASTLDVESLELVMAGTIKHNLR